MGKMVATFRKDPDEVLDYQFDWSEWLQSGETISTSTWEVETGITKDSDTNTTTTTTIYLSSGTDGETYTITNTIETNVSRTAVRSAEVVVEDR